ncbi:MAG TPA: hypothetical protein VFB15_00825 [Candidatus Binataceae bacterium]|jgi:acyl-CoA reductase-like NAD-dependent aldehyde dehydrogenase|nr:hypothetical protein [Candidatus Binataceae bacterium]
MDAAEKGARYAKVFRKAGALLARGRHALAVTTLEEGRKLAEANGDRAMARRFAREIARAQHPDTPPVSSEDAE